MICEPCGVQWDVNDTEPPTCGGTGQTAVYIDQTALPAAGGVRYHGQIPTPPIDAIIDRFAVVSGTDVEKISDADYVSLNVDDKTLRHVQAASGSVEAWKNFGADMACPSCGRGYGTQAEEVTRLNLALHAYREAVEEFVQRVEAGEIRSSYTYTKFKKLLGAL